MWHQVFVDIVDLMNYVFLDSIPFGKRERLTNLVRVKFLMLSRLSRFVVNRFESPYFNCCPLVEPNGENLSVECLFHFSSELGHSTDVSDVLISTY